MFYISPIVREMDIPIYLCVKQVVCALDSKSVRRLSFYIFQVTFLQRIILNAKDVAPSQVLSKLWTIQFCPLHGRNFGIHKNSNEITLSAKLFFRSVQDGNKMSKDFLVFYF